MGEKKKKIERKRKNMKYLLRFGDTHTHMHTQHKHISLAPGRWQLRKEDSS